MLNCLSYTIATMCRSKVMAINMYATEILITLFAIINGPPDTNAYWTNLPIHMSVSNVFNCKFIYMYVYG